MFDKLKQKINQTKQQVVEAVMLPEDQRNERLEICKQCENLNSLEFCRLCSCYMPAKTWIPITNCPIKKWTAVKNTSESSTAEAINK